MAVTLSHNRNFGVIELGDAESSARNFLTRISGSLSLPLKTKTPPAKPAIRYYKPSIKPVQAHTTQAQRANPNTVSKIQSDYKLFQSLSIDNPTRKKIESKLAIKAAEMQRLNPGQGISEFRAFQSLWLQLNAVEGKNILSRDIRNAVLTQNAKPTIQSSQPSAQKAGVERFVNIAQGVETANAPTMAEIAGQAMSLQNIGNAASPVEKRAAEIAGTMEKRIAAEAESRLGTAKSASADTSENLSRVHRKESRDPHRHTTLHRHFPRTATIPSQMMLAAGKAGR